MSFQIKGGRTGGGLFGWGKARWKPSRALPAALTSVLTERRGTAVFDQAWAVAGQELRVAVLSGEVESFLQTMEEVRAANGGPFARQTGAGSAWQELRTEACVRTARAIDWADGPSVQALWQLLNRQEVSLSALYLSDGAPPTAELFSQLQALKRAAVEPLTSRTWRTRVDEVARTYLERTAVDGFGEGGWALFEGLAQSDFRWELGTTPPSTVQSAYEYLYTRGATPGATQRVLTLRAPLEALGFTLPTHTFAEALTQPGVWDEALSFLARHPEQAADALLTAVGQSVLRLAPHARDARWVALAEAGVRPAKLSFTPVNGPTYPGLLLSASEQMPQTAEGRRALALLVGWALDTKRAPPAWSSALLYEQGTPDPERVDAWRKAPCDGLRAFAAEAIAWTVRLPPPQSDDEARRALSPWLDRMDALGTGPLLAACGALKALGFEAVARDAAQAVVGPYAFNSVPPHAESRGELATERAMWVALHGPLAAADAALTVLERANVAAAPFVRDAYLRAAASAAPERRAVLDQELLQPLLERVVGANTRGRGAPPGQVETFLGPLRDAGAQLTFPASEVEAFLNGAKGLERAQRAELLARDADPAVVNEVLRLVEPELSRMGAFEALLGRDRYPYASLFVRHRLTLEALQAALLRLSEPNPSTPFADRLTAYGNALELALADPTPPQPLWRALSFAHMGLASEAAPVNRMAEQAQQLAAFEQRIDAAGRGALPNWETPAGELRGWVALRYALEEGLQTDAPTWLAWCEALPASAPPEAVAAVVKMLEVTEPAFPSRGRKPWAEVLTRATASQEARLERLRVSHLLRSRLSTPATDSAVEPSEVQCALALHGPSLERNLALRGVAAGRWVERAVLELGAQAEPTVTASTALARWAERALRELPLDVEPFSLIGFLEGNEGAAQLDATLLQAWGATTADHETLDTFRADFQRLPSELRRALVMAKVDDYWAHQKQQVSRGGSLARSTLQRRYGVNTLPEVLAQQLAQRAQDALGNDPDASALVQHIERVFPLLPEKLQLQVLVDLSRVPPDASAPQWLKALLVSGGLLTIKLGQQFSEDPNVPTRFRLVLESLREDNPPRGPFELWPRVPEAFRARVEAMGPPLGRGSVKQVNRLALDDGAQGVGAFVVLDDAVALEEVAQALAQVDEVKHLVPRLLPALQRELDLPAEAAALDVARATTLGEADFIEIPRVWAVAEGFLAREEARGETLASITRRRPYTREEAGLLRRVHGQLIRAAFVPREQGTFVLSDPHEGNVAFDAGLAKLFDVGQYETLSPQEAQHLVQLAVSMADRSTAESMRRQNLTRLGELQPATEGLSAQEVQRVLGEAYDFSLRHGANAGHRFWLMLNEASRLGVRFPDGYFATAKMLHSIMSQEQIHGLPPAANRLLFQLARSADPTWLLRLPNLLWQQVRGRR